MIKPAFTAGLPSAAAKGLFLAHDSDRKPWLLRWDALRQCFAALGWPSQGNAEQRFTSPPVEGWEITGHQPIDWPASADPLS